MSKANELTAPVLKKSGINKDGSIFYEIEGGLTKREHFAGLAMQGIISHHGFQQWTCENIVETSIELADTLIAELEKSK